jgi:hypothetical protein
MRPSSWAVLALLLAATVAGAWTHDRRTWPGVVGDEATYLMAAQSLAWDGDLSYTRADHDRFVAQWGRAPDGLILQSADGGRTLTYGKEAAYPAWIAPFLRFSPLRGAQIANALLLAVAAIAAARTLGRTLGEAAPLWVAAWVFASVAFAYVFWAHSDLFLACLVALGLSVAYGGRPATGRERAGHGRGGPERGGRGDLLRWALAGALLAVPVLSRPPYLPLLLPVVLAAPPGRRRRALAGAAGGLLLVVLCTAAANQAGRGTWSGYSADRFSFYTYTGFPGDEGGSTEWEERVAELGEGTHSWIKPETLQMGIDARQTGWNLIYYLVGRHVGVVPYFLPLLLGLLAFDPARGRWAIPLVVLAAAALLFWIRPFNFYGGGGTIANRYFLPLYPALWFLAARPVRGHRAWLAPVAAALLAAPFLWQLWRAPRTFPLSPEGGYRYVGAVAARWLPYETTQSHLKPAGQEDFHHQGLWVKLLTPGLRGDPEALRLAAGERGQVLLGSPRPLAAVRIVAPRESDLRVDGAETQAPRAARPGGRRQQQRVAFAHPRAVHRMWWTDEPVYLYSLRVRRPAGAHAEIPFRILPEPAAPAALAGAPPG